jgi:hypothetical protein
VVAEADKAIIRQRPAVLVAVVTPEGLQKQQTAQPARLLRVLLAVTA